MQETVGWLGCILGVLHHISPQGGFHTRLLTERCAVSGDTREFNTLQDNTIEFLISNFHLTKTYRKESCIQVLTVCERPEMLPEVA